jgi:hypothetical protein
MKVAARLIAQLRTFTDIEFANSIFYRQRIRANAFSL